MDVRDWLVEIIQNSVGGCARHWAEVIADGLIENGVTVLSEDEAKNIYTVQQIEEIQNEAYDLGVDSVLRHKFGLSWDDAAELRTEIQRLQDAMKWISVKDRLPEKHKTVLCYGKNRLRLGIYIGSKYSDSVAAFRSAEDYYSFGATHWMPLPEMPAEKKKGGENVAKKIEVNERKYYIHIDGINLVYEDGELVGWYRP